MKALIIEDEAICANEIAKTLEQHGIASDICYTAEDGSYMVEACQYDVVIVDINLTGMTGNELIQQIRMSTKQSKKNMPIIVLSSLEKSEDKVEAFIHGADDFITKPLEKKEFIMRVLTAIRRCNGHSENKVKIGEIALDLRERCVYINNKPLKLSGKEYSLFQLLMLKKNNTLSKQEILDALYGGNEVPGMKIVDVLVCKIRKEIAKHTTNSYLTTVWGTGYVVRSPKLSIDKTEDDSSIDILQATTLVG